MKRLLALVATFGAVASAPPPPAFAEPLAASPEADPGDADATDGPRIRAGVSGEMLGLALVAPLEGYVGAGIRTHIGVQASDLVGVYLTPAFGIQNGIGGGLYGGSAILTDFTIGDVVGLGLGPELIYFANDIGGGHHFGPELGLRLHGAVYPFARRDAGGGRSSFVVGTGLRAVLGGVGFTDCGGCEQGGPLMLGANVFAGYELY